MPEFRGSDMRGEQLYGLLLDSLKDPFVFVDTEHVIRYMNRAAIEKFRDGEALLGRSIFTCHNESSSEEIRFIFEKMKSGLEERIITDNEKHRVYMRAVRDTDGNLAGYYERYEPPVRR